MWSDDDDYFSYSPYYFGSDMDDSDDDHYYDDEDYCGYSSGEDFSVVMSRRPRPQTEGSDGTTTTEDVSIRTYQVSSLQELCCRFIALKFPFAFVEHRSPPIPDELQLKIIEFSFPDDEEIIRKYAEFSRSSVDFSSAKRLLENGNVKDLNQIGGFLTTSSLGLCTCTWIYYKAITTRMAKETPLKVEVSREFYAISKPKNVSLSTEAKK